MKQAATLKIATYNINNVNRRLANLLAWLRRAKPDVVCLQELKAEQSRFPAEALERAGYGCVWRGQPTWNGVAILARGRSPIETVDRLSGDPSDKQSRYIEAAIEGILVGCVYLPNGNPQPGPRFEYKLHWFERLIRHARKLRKANVPAILAGDFNVVPTDFDIYRTTSWDDDALLHSEVRAAFKRLLKGGWTDAIRHMHPSDPKYTFWDYKRNRWPRDAGLRLDHLLLSPELTERLVAADVDNAERGKESASDHAPAWIKLRAV